MNHDGCTTLMLMMWGHLNFFSKVSVDVHFDFYYLRIRAVCAVVKLEKGGQ